MSPLCVCEPVVAFPVITACVCHSIPRFMDNLQTEVLEIEFLSYSKGMPTISEEDFARILLRYTNVDDVADLLENLRLSIQDEKVKEGVCTQCPLYLHSVTHPSGSPPHLNLPPLPPLYPYLPTAAPLPTPNTHPLLTHSDPLAPATIEPIHPHNLFFYSLQCTCR